MLTQESLDSALDNVLNLSDSLFMEISNAHVQIQDSLKTGVENSLIKANKLTFDYTRKAERALALREAVTLIKWHLEEQQKHEATKNCARS